MTHKPHIVKKTSMFRTVVFRTLLICLSFVVLPLLFHSFFMFHHLYNQQMNDHIVGVEIVANTSRSFNHLWELYMKRNITVFSQHHSTSEDLRTIAQAEDYAAFFTVVRRGEDNLVCVASANESRLGKVNQFSQFLAPMKEGEMKVFAAFDPTTQVTMILAAKATSETEIYVIGKVLSHWSDYFTRIFSDYFDYRLTVMSDDGVVLSSNDPNFSLDTVEVIPIWEIENKRREIRKTKKDFIAVKVPFPETNYFLFINFSKASIQAELLAEVLIRVAVFILLVIIVGGGGVLLLAIKMMQPLSELYHVMNEVGEGNLKVRYHPQKTGFEINQVGESFNQTVENLVSNMKGAEEARVQKEKLQKELNIARDIQMSVSPKELPTFKKLDIASRFLAAKTVSGDFYDLFPLEDELLVVMADASGKGIPSALYSLSVRSLLRSTYYDTRNLKEVVERTNQLFCIDTGDTGSFVTAWVGLFNRQTRKLQYNSSGHNPALLKRKNGIVEELTTQGMALGVSASEQAVITEIVLEPEELLLLYTDGLVEAHNEEKQLFSKRRVIELLKSQTFQTSESCLELLIDEVEKFSAGTEQFDDLTLLAIQLI